jgi:hypothetical protein
MTTDFLTSLLPVAPFIGLAWLSRVSKILHPHEYETVLIGSDPETIFVHSPNVKDHHHRKPAVVVPKPYHPDWAMADKVNVDLANSHWIADESSITLEEAISGGQYHFERKFTLPHELEDLVSADLLVLVDNWCTPVVNGHRFDRKGGSLDLIKWDLGNALQSGENNIVFEVENNPAVSYLADDPRWKEWNPYGLKYLIRITHPKA